MLQTWFLAAAVALIQTPFPVPQGPPAPGVEPVPGAVNPNAASALPPPPSPEVMAERIAIQATGLGVRIQSLRRIAGLGPGVDAASVAAPESRPSLDTLRALLGEVSRELQVRAHALEVKSASETASSLLQHRSIDLTGFRPAPDRKEAPAGARPDAEGPVLPAADPSRASDVVFRVGSIPITRGDIDEMVSLVHPVMGEASREQVATAVLRRTLVQSAVLRNAFPAQVADALARAKQIRDDVKSGKSSFEEAVKQKSEETAVKTFGGLVDGATPAVLSDFELRALARLKPGELSEPFLSHASVEVVELLEVHPSDLSPLQTTYKFRRLVLGVDMGVPASERFSKLGQLVLSTPVDVVDAAYESFLPPNVQRKPAGTPPPQK